MIHRCSFCDKTFARPSKLKNHVAFHHEKKYSFECRRCGKAYSSQDHVNRHYRTTHSTSDEPAAKFSCSFENCTKTFANKQNLDRHVRRSHQKTSEKLVQCFYCQEKVSSLENHLVAQHQSRTIENDTKFVLKCLDCSKEFSTLKSLNHHRFLHTDQRREQDVRVTLDRLLNLIEREKPSKSSVYRCDLCEKQFRSLFQLDQHRHSKIHHDSFRCPHENCNKVFVHMRNLRQHIRVRHEKSSALKCSLKNCSKSFSCQSSLARHVVRCHSTNEIFETIKNRNPKSKRSSSIRNLLSGFRRGNEKKIDALCRLLFDEQNSFDFEKNSENEQNLPEENFDRTLLNGFQEIGMTLL